MVMLENLVKFQSLEIRWILAISMHMQVNILRYINKLIIVSEAMVSAHMPQSTT